MFPVRKYITDMSNLLQCENYCGAEILSLVFYPPNMLTIMIIIVIRTTINPRFSRLHGLVLERKNYFHKARQIAPFLSKYFNAQ